jgi:hypothetical protein
MMSVRGSTASSRGGVLADWLIGSALFAGSLAVYLQTLAPSVATIFDDSLEFQLVCFQPGIAHPPGYPLYTLVGKLFTLLPLGDVAYRVNLMSAVFASLAVAFVYADLRLLAGYKVPALLGSAAFAVSAVFWSQAVIAEVYTLNAAFLAAVLCLLLAWAGRKERHRVPVDGEPTNSTRLLSLAALLFGLSLTHHRTMVLLVPAAIIFIALVDRRVFTRGSLMAKLTLLVVSPLALYLYLPVRGMSMSSLNGAYQNTLQGFLSYVTAGPYSIFLTANPLAQSRDLGFYVTLVRDQFTWAGLVLAAMGLAYSFTRWRQALLLVLFVATTALFGLVYKVPDVEVFLIPLFLVLALWIGVGFSALWEAIVAVLQRARQPEPAVVRNFLYCGLLVCGLLLPLSLWRGNQAQVDLSNAWDVHEYGRDILSQPLEDNAEIVGILGEITLLNYFQQTEALRPDLATIAADTAEERLAVVTSEMAQGHAVYLTRPLSRVDELYHLSSEGPLIRLQAGSLPQPPEPSHPLSVPFGQSIQLRGYDAEIRKTKVGPQLRVRLHWLAADESSQDYKVSVRLLNREGHLAAVNDSYPVRDAYRTYAWKPGEIVLDAHDLPILAGVPPGEYSIQVTMYQPELPDPLASTTAGTIALQPTLDLEAAGPWDVQRRPIANMGGRLKLLGYSLIGERFGPGDRVPLTLLWQGLASLDEEYTSLLWLDDGALPESEAGLALSSRYPPTSWQQGEVVRDWQSFLIPGYTEDGRYHLRMQVRAGNQPLSRLLWRLPMGNVVDLGEIQIEGRERSFELPSPQERLEASLGNSVRLLGYDLEPADAHAGDTLHLTLYWQSSAPMDTSYTVFVHLLDRRGQIQAQSDSTPGAGALPTTSWAQGEIIADTHEIPLPPHLASGLYPVAVGMYDVATGARLLASHVNGQSLGDQVLLGEIEVSSP